MGPLERIEQRRAATALGDARVQAMVLAKIALSVGLHRQRIDAYCPLPQLRALALRRELREPHRRLPFERLADDVMSLHVFGRRDAHSRAGAWPALEHALEFEAQQRLGD